MINTGDGGSRVGKERRSVQLWEEGWFGGGMLILFGVEE